MERFITILRALVVFLIGNHPHNMTLVSIKQLGLVVMKTSTRISEMRKFHFGRKIVCSDGDAGSLAHLVFDTPSNTTSLVSSRTEGLNLVGLDQPQDEILKEPEQHLSMHVRQGTTRDRGGESPRQQAEEAATVAAQGNYRPA